MVGNELFWQAENFAYRFCQLSARHRHQISIRNALVSSIINAPLAIVVMTIDVGLRSTTHERDARAYCHGAHVMCVVHDFRSCA